MIAGTSWSGAGLTPVTQEVQSVRVHNPARGDKSLVLVDTPGFDDTTSYDIMEKLLMIWLKKT